MAAYPKKVAVIGGGISGLSSAFYIQKLAKETNLPISITLIEKGPSVGGKIQTLHRDGFVIEKGPDSFLARKMPIIDITRELGLEGELVATNPNAKKTYILHNHRLHRMPPGLVLGIPTQLSPFIKTGLISMSGKARAALDLLKPRRTETTDESLGSFLQRRLGKEVLDHIAEPLLAGIYAGDTRSLSLRATFPQFHSVEQKHRSLILGMMASKKNPAETDNLPGVAKNSMFLTYRKGLVTLVDGIVKALDDVRMMLGTGVNEIKKADQGYTLLLDDGNELAADAVIVTLPTYALGGLFPNLPFVKQLLDIPYVSVANCVLAFDKKDIRFNLDGSGFVIPRKEGRSITACTWTSVKWLHTAPEGKVLLRCYVGRSGEEHLVHKPDDEIVRIVRDDLKHIMGIDAEPLFTEVTRLERSMPQYPVGHLDRIKQARAQLEADMPGVYVTGAGFHGVGIPDCIRQGKEAAQQAMTRLFPQ